MSTTDLRSTLKQQQRFQNQGFKPRFQENVVHALVIILRKFINNGTFWYLSDAF